MTISKHVNTHYQSRFDISWHHYVLAIGGPTLLAALALALDAFFGGINPDLAIITVRFGLQPSQIPLLFVLTPLIYLITLVSGGPIAEEFGWRGFAQPHLQEWIGVNRAGAIIGALWSLWHLPLFLILPAATGNVLLQSSWNNRASAASINTMYG